ncbi:MAG: hypothetical protein WAO02_18340 [Verrucomicrobiia bacterium]
MERIAFALQPTGYPVAHIDVEIVTAKIAGAVQHLFEMSVARVKMMCLGCEPPGETGGQIGFEKTFGFLRSV